MSKSNVVKIRSMPPPERTISEMMYRETGYTKPWAYKDENLDINFRVFPHKRGANTLLVFCVGDGKYEISFE